MEHVAHQVICMQYMLELSKHLEIDPRACVGSFFSRLVEHFNLLSLKLKFCLSTYFKIYFRIQVGDAEYKQSFEDELRSFKDRIRKRAEEKLEAAMKEVEEEERQARLGPGGLDPLEVLESLPEVGIFRYLMYMHYDDKFCFEK